MGHSVLWQLETGNWMVTEPQHNMKPLSCSLLPITHCLNHHKIYDASLPLKGGQIIKKPANNKKLPQTMLDKSTLEGQENGDQN